MDDTKILAIVEERTRLLPDMDRRLRDMAETQAAMDIKVARNEEDIQKVTKKVDNLNILDKVWNGINTVAVAIMIYLQTGKIP